MLILYFLIQITTQQKASQNGMNEDSKTVYQSYYQQLLPYYIVDMSFPSFFAITMKISGDESSDSPYIQGGPDMFIQLNYTSSIVQCDQIWELQKLCGTYLEVHKSMDKDIIFDQQIKKIQEAGSRKIYMLTKGLASGRYEIWVVVRSRVGSVIQYVKPFFITIVNK